MVSEIQLRANRENSKLGGPKTEAGKAISSRNATKHSLLSKQVLLPGESARELNKLWRELMAEYQPQGVMETLYVDYIISCIWRLPKVLKVETDNSEDDWSGIRANTNWDVAKWQSLSRYETTIVNRIYKSTKELERIQASRKGKDVPPRLSIDVDVDHH